MKEYLHEQYIRVFDHPRQNLKGVIRPGKEGCLEFQETNECVSESEIGGLALSLGLHFDEVLEWENIGVGVLRNLHFLYEIFGWRVQTVILHIVKNPQAAVFRHDQQKLREGLQVLNV